MVPNFDAIDTNHDGKISRDEFRKFGQQSPRITSFAGMPCSGPASASSVCAGRANAFAACQRQNNTPGLANNLSPSKFNSSQFQAQSIAPRGQTFSPRSLTPSNAAQNNSGLRQSGAFNQQFDYDPAPKVLAFRQFVTQLMDQASGELAQNFEVEFSGIRSEVQNGQLALAESNVILQSKDNELDALRVELAKFQDLLAQRDQVIMQKEQEIAGFHLELSRKDQELAQMGAEVSRAQGIINRFEQKEQVLANMVQAAAPALATVQNVFSQERNTYSGPTGYQATNSNSFFDAMDANHDGGISRGEFERFQRR